MKAMYVLALLMTALLVTRCGTEPVADSANTETIPAAQSSESLFGVRKAGFNLIYLEVFDGTEISNAYAAFETLAKRDVGIVLHWEASNLDDPVRWDFVRAARTAGVEVQPWLLLDEEDGYWPGSTNATQFAAAARELSNLWISRGFAPTRFVVDMEIRWDRIAEFNEILASPIPDLVSIAGWLWENTDRVQYAAATQTYANLVKDLHDQGWLVHISTLPQVLDDFTDGDDGLRQAFGIPFDGIDWDTISFQVYRTAFNDLVPVGEVTPFFVADYGRMARERFGNRVHLDLGLTGTGVDAGNGITPSYPNGDELARDVAAAFGAGFTRDQIGVFNLQGMLDKPPLSHSGW